MNFLKKTLVVTLAFLMTFTALSVFAGAESETVLQFGSDGKFEIMIFADIQDDYPVEETTLQVMNEALDKYKPDMVVYLGDNTVAPGYEFQYKAIESITKPCNDRNIPYSIVFGNHDQENGVTKEDLLKIYQEFGCLTYDADPEIYGCGNCNLPILSSDGTKTAFNLWFIDSGSNNPDEGARGYDFVRESQIEWYRETAEKLRAENGGEAVPAINFQHIIVPEAYEALGYAKIPAGIEDYNVDGKHYFPVPNLTTHSGYIFETPSSPFTNAGQFDAWVEMGDIKACFVGHDHINTFETTYQGINLTNVPTVGCRSYSNDLSRGVGLVTINESDASFSYELIHMYDLALEEDSKILDCEGAMSAFYYKAMRFMDKIFTKLHEWML